MAGWYRVVKTIKGHQYLYDQQTYRVGDRVFTRNRYLGRAEGETTTPAQSGQKSSPVRPPPLFRDPSDFGAALVKQFDIAQWGKDAQQQVLGGASSRGGQRRKTRPAVTTTSSPKPAHSPTRNQTTNEEYHLSPHRRITDAHPKDFLGINMVWLAEQAKERGYNLYDALITRVDGEKDIRNKVHAIHGILDEILDRNPHEATTTLDKSVTTTPALRHPAPPDVQGKQANQAEAAATSGSSPRDVQAEITSKIIQAIETGRNTGTFQMPWQAVASEGFPVNAVTHQPYHGVNVLILSFDAFERKWPNQWASFQQWRERGASVKKGEHGVPIVFYSPVQIQDVAEDDDGKTATVLKIIPVFRYSTVFNIAQVDNPPPVTTTPPDQVVANEEVEQFINATKADIRYGEPAPTSPQL